MQKTGTHAGHEQLAAAPVSSPVLIISECVAEDAPSLRFVNPVTPWILESSHNMVTELVAN